jgi:hypothetical protein
MNELFERYVVQLRVVLDELIAHYKEVVDPSLEKIDTLLETERLLEQADTSDDSLYVPLALKEIHDEAYKESLFVGGVYDAMVNTLGEMQELIVDAKYEEYEPLSVSKD